jgi:hypothetical protein
VISAPEVAKSLYGAWRLARLDSGGMDQFDSTLEVFWRSFNAMLIVAPGHLILVAMSYATFVAQGGPVYIFLVEVIAYVIGWFAFPLAMVYVSDVIDRKQHYFRYIAASNWAVVLQIALLLVVVAITHGFAFTAVATGYAQFAAMIAVLVYSWFIARSGLEIKGGAAALIVGLDLGISFVINSVKMSMLT